MRPLDRLLDLALAVAVAVPATAIFLQVVFRYVLNDPSSWLDEFAVLVFAWMTLVGAAVVQRTDGHLAIDLVVKRLPKRARLAAEFVRIGAITVVLVVLFWQGLRLTEQMSFVEYPAMGVSRAFLFAILPVCTPLVLLYAMRSARRRMRAVLASGSAR